MREKTWYALSAVVLIVSAAIRVAAYPIFTSDYTYFIAKWFDQLKSHPGLTAFQYPFADYSPLYVYFLKILTYIPVYSLYSEKTLSLVFDILIAWGAYLLLRDTSDKEYTPSQLFLVFAIMLSIPTVVVNTSLWGQSDSVYTAGVVFALYFILRDKPLPAALAYALALSIKLQAIFFLPILVGYYWRRGAKDLWQLLLIPAVYIVTIIPAWLGGASFMGLLLTYFNQSKEYTDLSVSAQSIFAFFTYLPISGGARSVLFWLGIIIAGVCAVGITYLMSRIPPEKSSAYKIVFLSVVCVLIIPYLLPRMHERYFYLADVLSVIYACYRPRQWFIPVAIVIASFVSYMPFLSGQVSWFAALHIDLRVGASILAITLGVMLLMLYQEWREQPSRTP